MREIKLSEMVGGGYADISFTSKDEDVGIIVELKQTSDVAQRDPLADAAVLQIEEKNYAANYLAQKDITAVFAFGLCFCRKSCSVSVKKLK